MSDVNAETRVTPIGRCEWAKIIKPDKKWNSEGTYSIDLILPEAEAVPLLEEARQAIAVEVERTKAEHPDKEINYSHTSPFKKFNDEGEPSYRIKFKQDAEVTPKGKEPYHVDISVFDADGKEWDENVMIGNDSKVCISYRIYCWDVAVQGGIGITLKLRAVQVVNLVEYERDARSFGFKNEGEVSANGSSSTSKPLSDIPF